MLARPSCREACGVRVTGDDEGRCAKSSRGRCQQEKESNAQHHELALRRGARPSRATCLLSRSKRVPCNRTLHTPAATRRVAADIVSVLRRGRDKVCAHLWAGRSRGEVILLIFCAFLAHAFHAYAPQRHAQPVARQTRAAVGADGRVRVRTAVHQYIISTSAHIQWTWIQRYRFNVIRASGANDHVVVNMDVFLSSVSWSTISAAAPATRAAPSAAPAARRTAAVRRVQP